MSYNNPTNFISAIFRVVKNSATEKTKYARTNKLLGGLESDSNSNQEERKALEIYKAACNVAFDLGQSPTAGLMMYYVEEAIKNNDFDTMQTPHEIIATVMGLAEKFETDTYILSQCIILNVKNKREQQAVFTREHTA